MATKLSQNQISIVMSLIICLNFNILQFKVMHKNKFIDQVVNNIWFTWNFIDVLRTFSKYVIMLTLLVEIVNIGYKLVNS